MTMVFDVASHRMLAKAMKLDFKRPTKLRTTPARKADLAFGIILTFVRRLKPSGKLGEKYN
jgi:hypothetical protein